MHQLMEILVDGKQERMRANLFPNQDLLRGAQTAMM